MTGFRFGERAIQVKKHGWGVGVTGEETETVYFGTRKAEVRAKAYDKRQQLLDTAGTESLAPFSGMS